MSEYTRGQEGRREGHSGHNEANEVRTRPDIRSVDFEGMNFEQRRVPYGLSEKENSDGFNSTGNGAPDGRRENF